MNMLTEDEKNRLSVLESYRILDTMPEKEFDDLTEMASLLCGTSIALISLIDKDRQWFKSRKGLQISETDRAHSFCAYAITSPNEMLVVEDAHLDSRFKDNPFVTGEPYVSFYAGVRLVTDDGFVLGSLCVIDHNKKILTPEQQNGLSALARQVMDKIELRKKIDELKKINNTLQETQVELHKTIEEKNILEINLRNNEYRLQSILDTMAEGVGIVDMNGQLVYANAMAQRILGLAESKIKKRTYADNKWRNIRLDGTPLPEEEHPMAIMMKSGQPIYDAEIGVKPPEGNVLYIAINAAPLRDYQGNVIGGVGTFMDVTTRRKFSQQQDQFLGVASHEMKTPLTALKAILDLLFTIKDDAQQHEILPTLISKAHSTSTKLLAMMDDLMDVNRMSRGEMLLNKTLFAVLPMLKECCKHLNELETHQINIEGSADLLLCADEARISQVVINFLNNAVKYAPRSRLINVTANKKDKNIIIAVRDYGEGISEERITYLFERYHQENKREKRGGGLGLGLYISSEIIKAHNGEIGAESESGKGSTFWFSLPAINECS